MRRLLLLAVLPLMGAAPGSLKILEASVTWGSGVEPRDSMPAARFEARVAFQGRKLPAKAQFRARCLNVRDLRTLEPDASIRKLYDRHGNLEITVRAGATGTWTIQGPWPHAPESDDRLVVEVWSGSRRLGWAAAPLVELALPVVAGPQRDPIQH